MPCVIYLALERLRQKNVKIEVKMDNIARFCLKKKLTKVLTIKEDIKSNKENPNMKTRGKKTLIKHESSSPTYLPF